MFSRSLAVVALSVCILLVMANTSYAGYLVLPRQGRSDDRAEPSCCGMPLMKASGICPIGMECCPGLKKVLQKSGQRTVYSVCVADLY